MNESYNDHEDTYKIENASHKLDNDHKDNSLHFTDSKHEREHNSDKKEHHKNEEEEEEKQNHGSGVPEKHEIHGPSNDKSHNLEEKKHQESTEIKPETKPDTKPETHPEDKPAANHQHAAPNEEDKTQTDKPVQNSEDASQTKNRPSTDASKPVVNEENLLGQSVFKVFADAVLQRKKSSYDKFYQWEHRRAEKINSYRSICENIIERLNSKTSTSIDGTEGVIRFFTDRKNQEELYYTAVTRNLVPLGNLFSDKTLKDGAEWSLPKLLREYDEFHLRQTKNAQEMAGFIQKTVLKDILLEMQKESVKKLNSLKDKLSEARKRVNAINQRTAKKAVKYSNLINQLFKAQYKQTKQKDLYNKELSIISSSQIQTETHREFGKEVVNFWKSAEHIETARFNNVKRALGAYTDKIGDVYGPAYGDPQGVKKLLTAFEVENEVKSVFSAASLLTAEEIKYIKGEHGLADTTELSTEHVQKFLENFTFEAPTTKPLVLKEWEAQRESGTFKSFKPCSVVVTVDGNLLLIDRSDERVFKKADSVIKLHQISVKDNPTKKNPLIVDFLETIPGFLIDSKNKYVIKFNSMDQVDEFNHYLTNYKRA